MKSYPYLEEEDLRESLRYATRRVEEIEVPLAAQMKILFDMNLSPD